MKKLLFSLLLISSLSNAQALFDKGVKITGGITTDNSAPNVVVKSSNNVLNTIAKTELQDAFYFATASALPVVGITDKLYITRDDNKLYRFDGTIYVPFSGGITSTATTNFIPKVDAGGNLENSVITQNGTNIGLNVASPNRPLQVSGSATGAAHVVEIVNTDTSVNLGFLSGQAPNMANGQVLAISMGKMPSTNNRVSIAYNHSSDGSSNNSLRFSFFGSANLFNVFAGGQTTIGTAINDGINRLQVNGTVSVATATQPNQAPRLEQVIQTTGNQTNIVGLKTFLSDNTTQGGISIGNSRTGGIGLNVSSSLGRGINVDASGGVGARFFGGTTATESLVVVKGETTTGILLQDLSVTDTGDFIKVNGQNTGGQFTFLNRFGVASARAGTANENLTTLGQIKSRDGWASYSTTAYTNASPFTVAPNTTVTLPNNANNSITSDLPLGVTAFYNGTTNKITPVAVGDAYTVNVRFKARTTMNNDYLTLFIDIGAGTQINAEAKQFLKGANTEQAFSFTMPIFTLATFVANGGEIKVSSNSGTISIYDVTFYINRNYTR